MVDSIKLTADLIQAANEFLCGGTCDGTAPGKKPFFTATDVGADLVDQYSSSAGDTLDPRSWLGKVSDGRIGVRTTDVKGNITERLIVHSGNAGSQSCPADVNIKCAAPQAIAKYDPARVAAFFAATFGFSGLHEGKAKDRVPGQMQVLRQATRAGRIMLDEALTKFGRLGKAPEKILITEELRGKINAFLNEGRKPAAATKFLTKADEGKYLVHRNPTAKNKSHHLTGDGNGIIGVVLGTTDAPVEKLLVHTGNSGQFTCNADYATCTAQPGGTFPKERVLMLQAALFGFSALYDKQLLQNFAQGGPKEQTQRRALDAALTQFAGYRKPTAIVTAPPPVAPPPVEAPPVVAAPTAPPPVDTEEPAAKIPPQTAEVPVLPAVVAKDSPIPEAPVAEPEPIAPPTETADDDQNLLMEYVADAVDRVLEYGRNIIEGFKNYEPAPADATPTVTYKPLMSPADAMSVGGGAWGIFTGLDYLQTAFRLRRAYAAAGFEQPVTAGVVMRGAPIRLNIPIRGIRFRTVATGALVAIAAVGLALIPVEQSEGIPLTVQSDDRLSDD